MSRHTPTAAEQLHYDLSNLAQFIANVLEALESHEGYSVGDSYDDTMTLEELASDLRAAFIAYTEHDPDSDAAAAAKGLPSFIRFDDTMTADERRASERAAREYYTHPEGGGAFIAYD